MKYVLAFLDFAGTFAMFMLVGDGTVGTVILFLALLAKLANHG